MTEKNFENALKKMVKDYWPSSHTKKLATPYMGGVLDLYTKIPGFPSMWVELKYVKRESKIPSPLRPVKLELTELQRNFIRLEQAAGGNAGWMAAIEWSSGVSIICSGHDPDCQYLQPDDIMRLGVEGRKFHRSREDLSWLFENIIGTISVETKLH